MWASDLRTEILEDFAAQSKSLERHLRFEDFCRRKLERIRLKAQRCRLKRVSRGLCQRCGKPRGDTQYSHCDACLTERRGGRPKTVRVRTTSKAEGLRKLRQRRAAAGLCYDCGKNPARPQRTRCATCADRDRNRRHERRS